MNFSPIIKNREILTNTLPALRYDPSTDFAAWQRTAREQLSALLGINRFVSCPPDYRVESSASFDTYDECVFSLESEADYRFTCTLRTPKSYVGKLPVAICLFGNSEDLAVSMNGDNDRDLCAQALSRGCAALTIEQRNFDNCFSTKDVPVPEAYTRTTWCACYRSSMRAAMLGRTTLGERVWDIMRAIDVMLSNFAAIDADNIFVVGNSGNATAAYYAASIDERISGVIASSGVATWESSIAAFSHCACNYVPKISNYFDMGDIGGLIAPRKLVLMGATEDVHFPIRGLEQCYALIRTSYAAAGAPDACKLIVKNGPRRFYAEDAWNALL